VRFFVLRQKKIDSSKMNAPKPEIHRFNHFSYS
jgi:hypothetical protein